MERCQNVAMLNCHTTGYSQTTLLNTAQNSLFEGPENFLTSGVTTKFLEEFFVLEFVKLKLTVTNVRQLMVIPLVKTVYTLQYNLVCWHCNDSRQQDLSTVCGVLF